MGISDVDIILAISSMNSKNIAPASIEEGMIFR